MAKRKVTKPHPDGVIVGIATNGSFRSVFANCLTDMFLRDCVGSKHLFRQGCGRLSLKGSMTDLPALRNGVAADFCARGSAEWLLMLDADMGFEPDVMDRLLRAAKAAKAKIITGLYFAIEPVTGEGRTGEIRRRLRPCAYEWCEREDGMKGFAPVLNYARNAIQRIDSAGLGCTLVHIDVLRKIYADLMDHERGPFDTISVPNATPEGAPRVFGEDMSFFMRVARAGFELYLDSSTRFSHDKGNISLTEDLYDEQGGGTRTENWL